MRINVFRQWLRGEQGVVAVEFGLVALPFFILLMGIIESGLFFAAGSVLEGASNDAARLIRTGAAQTSADPETAFRTELCNKVGVMLDCNKIQYEVIQMASGSFAEAETTPPQFDENGNLISTGFSTGNSNDVVLIRAVYKYDFLTPFLGAMMTGTTSRNWMLHMATVVIKAEPYRFGEK